MFVWYLKCYRISGLVNSVNTNSAISRHNFSCTCLRTKNLVRSKYSSCLNIAVFVRTLFRHFLVACSLAAGLLSNTSISLGAIWSEDDVVVLSCQTQWRQTFCRNILSTLKMFLPIGGIRLQVDMASQPRKKMNFTSLSHVCVNFQVLNYSECTGCIP